MDHLSALMPYAVNFSVVILLLVFLTKNPLKKYVYQRHERTKDALESASIAHNKIVGRVEAARAKSAAASSDEAKILSEEKARAKEEAAAVLASLKTDANRISSDAERLLAREQEESADRVREEFLNMVVSTTSEKLEKDLKSDDHSAILNRARTSIEVGA